MTMRYSQSLFYPRPSAGLKCWLMLFLIEISTTIIQRHHEHDDGILKSTGSLGWGRESAREGGGEEQLRTRHDATYG